MTNLSDQHLINLKEDSQINLETLSSAGVFSASSKFCKEEYGLKDLTGIAFPYYNFAGDLLGVRLKKDIEDEYGKYMQKKGTKLALYFPPTESEKIQSINYPLIITEGEKKCLSLLSNIPKSEAYAFVAIPGCWNFKDSEKQDIHDIIKNIPLRGRRIIFMGDSDMFYNYNVFSAYLELIRFCISQAAKVELIDLRINDSGKKVGVDDFIKEKGIDELIKRVRKPYWCFSKFAPDALDPDNEHKNDIINRILKESVLVNDQLCLQDLYRSLKDIFKANLSDLKSIRQSFLKTWNANSPRPKSNDNDIFHNPCSQSIKEIATDICQAISTKRNLYLGAETNSFIELIENPNDVKFKTITNSEELSSLLPRYLNYNHISLNKDGITQILRQDHIPQKILSTVLSNPREFAEFQEIEFITKSPTFFKNRIIQNKGHHKLEKIYIDCEEILIPQNMFHLKRILDSFPFMDDASRDNALAFFITQAFFLNEFIGEHPAVIINGDSPNVGKTTLAQISCIIANGEQSRTLKFHENNDAENEKNIASVIQSSNVIFFDNIRSNSTISSASIERSITDRYLNFRLLGKNVMTGRLNNVQFIFTINGGKFSEDLIIRSIPIFLSANSKTKIDLAFDVKAYTLEHRKEILGELIHLVNQWVEAGMSKSNANFPKFPKWASTICGLLKSNSIDSALSNFDDAKAILDPAIEAILIFVLDEMISEKKKLSVKKASDFLQIFYNQKIDGFFSQSEKSKETRIGKMLIKLNDRTIPISYLDEIYALKIECITNPSGGNNKMYKFITVTSVTSSLVDLNEKNISPMGKVFNIGQEGTVSESHDVQSSDEFLEEIGCPF